MGGLVDAWFKGLGGGGTLLLYAATTSEARSSLYDMISRLLLQGWRVVWCGGRRGGWGGLGWGGLVDAWFRF